MTVISRFRRLPRLGRLRSGSRWTLGAWLTLAFVGAFTPLCVAVGVYLLAQPGDGCQFKGGALTPPRPIQACFGTWPTPLRPGDQVVSVEGIPVGNLVGVIAGTTPSMPGGWTGGRTVSYTVLRDGVSLKLQVPLGRLDFPGIAGALGASFARQIGDSYLIILIGSLLIFLLAPNSEAARLLLIASGPLFAMTTFLWAGDTVANQFAPRPVVQLYLTFASLWGWLFVPTLLLLVLSFPRRIWPVSRWPRRAAAAIYGLPIAVTLAELVSGRSEPYYFMLGLGALLVICCAIGAALHTFLRSSDPVLRAQTAWMALGVSVSFAFVPLYWTLITFIPGLSQANSQIPEWANALLTTAVGSMFLLSMGVAITRYHLFDIELIIRRTLIYGLLTALLAGVYFGGVVLLQALLRPLTGAGNDLAVVATTLLIAALFLPLRQRVQGFIDRRFYRRKYDATKTLAAFGHTVRDEVELDRLTGRLVEVVDETMRPAHVSLWLANRAGRPENPGGS
jgi:hypothetical protein